MFSKSESLFNNPFAAVTDIATSSVVEFVSGFATGASLIGVTVISNVLLAVLTPSLTV